MPASIAETIHGGFPISTDPTRIDLVAVHAFLTTSYWAVGRTLETQRRAVDQGHLVVGVYSLAGEQVGFARMVTDLATYEWLADVDVLPPVRGYGLGTALVRTIVEPPDVADVTWQFLATRDAHGLYARFGVSALDEPERWMHRRGGA